MRCLRRWGFSRDAAFTVNSAQTVADKVSENERAMMQLNTNTREQAMLGDYPKAVDDAVKKTFNDKEKFANAFINDFISFIFQN